MSKFKVGDLITDKKILIQILDVKETYYTIKDISFYYQGKTRNTEHGWVDNLCVKYDLDNPLTKKVNNGVCYCNECSGVLHYGDECVRYDGEIFCCEKCLRTYIGKCSEDGIVETDDLDDSSTTERPLFELTEEQIKEIKKGLKQYE